MLQFRLKSYKGALMTYKIGIYMFDNMEVLDFAGPYEVFTTASRVAKKMNAALEQPPFEVLTIGKIKHATQARAGLKFYPDYTIESHPTLDVLLIPGGVITQELQEEALMAWIKAAAHQTLITASICTGAFLLAKAGLLDGKRATTHWEDIDELQSLFPEILVEEGLRFVDEGEVVTSGGISAGIDMSLHLVERLSGRELALATARQMEFDWRER
jgi:transcriptional regulator GlxA family with amidase domain